MAQIKNIELINETQEIRIDWDNDRHISIKLKSNRPEDVESAFLDAAREISIESMKNKI